MATQIGDVKADNVLVQVADHFALVYIEQDSDKIILAGETSLQNLIEKLQQAQLMIKNAKKGK